MDEKIKQFAQMMSESRDIVFFGGAGVSTESGIPDFRSVDGLYNQKWKYPPEVILSRSFFDAQPEEFFRFYREKLLLTGIKPSGAHKALARLEAMGRLSAVVTQNIDGLHQDAGSRRVLELHGSVRRNYCMKCGRFYSGEELAGMPLVPRCACGGMIKPDVVLYEEALDPKVLDDSIAAISRCDMLIIGGTSLSVYPAAGLIRYFRGDHLVIINKTEIQGERGADLVIRGSIGKTLSDTVDMLEGGI